MQAYVVLKESEITLTAKLWIDFFNYSESFGANRERAIIAVKGFVFDFSSQCKCWRKAVPAGTV